MNNRCLIPVLILFFIPGIIYSQSSEASGAQQWSLRVNTGAGIPLGEGSDAFRTDFATDLSVDWRLHDDFPLLVSAGVNYSLVPTVLDYSVSSFGVFAGAAWPVRLAERFEIRLGGNVGYFWGTQMRDNGVSASYLGLLGSADFVFTVNRTLDLGLRTGYRSYPGMYGSIEITAMVSTYFTGRNDRSERIIRSMPYGAEYLQGRKETPSGRGLQITEVDVKPVFPVFYKYYLDYPVGIVTIENLEKEDLTIDTVVFNLKQYMDSPLETELDQTVPAGESSQFLINALFSNKVLNITEADLASADIVVRYVMDKDEYQTIQSVPVSFQNRNAMTWDDTNKVAAFVTSKDPNVLQLSRNVINVVNRNPVKALNPRMLIAMGLYEAMGLTGLSYAVDPVTPFADFSNRKEAVDFIQFPAQTLNYRTGDCDDLSILFCSMLEAATVESAFVTVPGHIFAAFNTGLSANEAGVYFPDVNKVIFHNDQIWIPVELTDRNAGFNQAWASGARQWQEHFKEGNAEIYPVRTAWNTYPAVSLPEIYMADSASLSDEEIQSAFMSEMVLYADTVIQPQVKELENRIQREGEIPSLLNKLGILYARYGMEGKAEASFNKALKNGVYPPALINLGNLKYLSGDYQAAREIYLLAYEAVPDNPRVLLSLSRTCYKLGEVWDTQRYYLDLKKADPALAERYAYLSGGSTAARAGSGVYEEVLWTIE